MNLVGYTATALSRNDIEDTPTNKNVVDFAIVELKDLQGNLVVMYDDAEGANPETQKVCDTNGQIDFFAEAGDYDLEINGKAQRINLLSGLASSIETSDGRSVQERFDDLPNEVDAAGTAVTLIEDHNSDSGAHPELSSFITSEADRAETAAESVKPYVDSALSDLSTSANKFYPTLAEANADIVNIEVNQPIHVGEAVNGGLWYKATSGATTLTKSSYDPLVQAKSYTSEKVELSKSSTNKNIVEARDSNGTTYLIVTADAKYKLLGLDGDLVGIVNDLRANSSSLLPLVSLIAEKSTSGTLLEGIDVNGKQVFRQGANGHVYLPHIGNLTQTILDLVAKQKARELVDVGTKYTDYALANNVADSQQNLNSLLKATDFDALNLVAHDVGVLRLPAITRLSQYKFLVFFDAMPAQDDFGIISTCCMTVNIDPTTYALTKTDIKVIHESFNDNGKQRSFIQNVGVKTNSGKVICIYTRRHEKSEHELYMRTSTDDGVTFSEFTDISYVKNNAGLNGLFACSQGFVKRYGKHKGRIIFPVWTTGVGYLQSEYRAGFIYSDDDGLTWSLGKLAPYSTGNEVQAAEDINGDMLFSIRVQTGDSKIIARYSESTGEYTRLYTDTVITYDSVMSGLIQGDNKYDFSPAKFTLATARNADRTEMLIHTSYDGGKTWATKFVNALANKPVAYVSLDNITATHKLFIWESGGVKDLDYSVMTIDNFIKGDL